MTKEEKESQIDTEYVSKLIHNVNNKNWEIVNTLLFKSNLNNCKIALYSSGITTCLLASLQLSVLAEFYDFLYETSDKETQNEQ